MSRRLAAALLGAALAACSAPGGKTCTQTSDCGAGNVCSAGFCQVAIQTSITSGPAVAVASSSATFQFSSTPAGATFECSLDGAPYAACSNPVTFTGLADGAHSLDVRARNAENVSAPASWAWGVDMTPPNTAIDSGPTGTVIGGVSIAFSSPEASATFECALDGASWAACTSPQTFSTPALGTHSFQVRALDALGNADTTPAQRGWSTAADTTITANPVSPVASSTATFQFTASDGSATFECSLDGAGFAACVTGKTYTALSDGSHNFQVRATGGGVADPSPASYTWSIDTTGPVVNLTGTPAATQSENPSFTFSSPEGTATFECRLDAGVWAACTSPKGYVVPSTLAIGSHTFYVRGRDTLGNYTASPSSYAWTQAPETTITWAPLAWTNRSTEKVAFSSTSVSATFECSLDGALYAACTSPRTLSVANGPHTFNVRAVVTSGGTYTDQTPATTSFSVSTTNALLYYNFEGSAVNTGLLSGYTGTASGAAGYSSAWSHSATGLNSASFSAQEGSPPTNRGSIALTGVRQVLQHDFTATDGAYTIAFWFNEHSPANTMSTTSGLSPTIFANRYHSTGAPGGGFEIYHGVGATQPPSWGLCWSSSPANAACAWSAGGSTTGTGHRMVIEYAYNGGTTGYDLTVYIDGTAVITTSSAAGQVIFNSLQNDPVIGSDWWGYIDDLRVWNRTFGGSPP